MNYQPEPIDGVRASRFRVSRSRGALSGVLIVLLGAWAALIAFWGPDTSFSYAPPKSAGNDGWHWTAARFWLEVLPGAVAVVCGLLLLVGTNRLVTLFAGWLAAAAGAWLVLAPALAEPLSLNLGIPNPASSTNARAFESIAYFLGVGAAIVFLAAVALGRLSVHSLSDVRAAERRAIAEAQAAREAEERAAAEHEALLQEARERDAAARQAAADQTRVADEHAQFAGAQSEQAQLEAERARQAHLRSGLESDALHRRELDKQAFDEQRQYVPEGRHEQPTGEPQPREDGPPA